MRRALLLATAIVPLLIKPAGAQVAQDTPVSQGVKHAPVTARPQKGKKGVHKPTAIKADQLPPAAPPAPAPQAFLSIDSMDLRQAGQSASAFSIPITPPPPAAPVPSQAIPAGPGTVPPPPALAATAAPRVPLMQQGSIRIEPVAGTSAAILLRAEPDVGLAAFRIGEETLIVLDAPIIFGAPGPDIDTVFAQLVSHPTQDATVIRIPNGTGAFRLSRNPRGWMVAAEASTDPVASILPRLITGNPAATSVRLPVSNPSRVVTVLNPRTGDRLLVGTQGESGQGVPNEWKQPQFTLLPTLQGVVVAATSDDIRLRREADGFTLSTSLQADNAIPVAKPKASDPPIAGAISRLFEIPNGTIKELEAELDKRVLAAGNAHALARSEPRLRVAEAMLALGMDVEAQAVVDVAAASDPGLMDQPRAIGLRAVASTLAGRIEDGNKLMDPQLPESTEIELWRAYLNTITGSVSAKDARGLADGLPLVLAYPAPLRDRMLPLVLETMALNGQVQAAQAAMSTLPNDRNLDLARAMAFEMDNKPSEALKLYDQVAARDDRLPRYEALVRSAELRMKTGEYEAKSGADALDRALLGWRGAKEELALRMRIADLRRQAGQWREALTVLRDARDIFPDQRASIDQKMGSIFLALLADDASRHLSPSDFVAIYDQNQDLVQDIAWTEKTGTELVNRLVGLDLLGRAEPIMNRLVTQATDPVRRAVLGARLASLRIANNNPSGAIDALATTVPPANATVTPAIMGARQLLYARAEADRGNKDVALGMLDNLASPDADEARAEIYAARKDWPHTVAALTAYESKKITSADLSEADQGIVLRLAEAATLSGDTATLERVAGKYGPAMEKSHSAALFRLLTSAPATGTADLPRAFEEISMAKQLEGHIGPSGSP